ncbi:hypothetical protein ONA23_05460 [Mycoplasmopsis cynos]|nr:hypothetical protein [Mycoplasmopsis cynos]WAM06404.1 hypothetical protein ONA23_05460 [Mycoplasmopsis cynos]
MNKPIGFLRIFNTSKYLDKTFIHPDSYELALKVINDYKLQPSDQGIDVSFLDANELVSKYNSNIYDINLILNALSKPVKRIKKDKSGFILKSSVTNFNDLKVGLNVVGTIENITDFGLFVYIGMKENLFIHINNLNIDLKLKSQFDEFFQSNYWSNNNRNWYRKT